MTYSITPPEEEHIIHPTPGPPNFTIEDAEHAKLRAEIQRLRDAFLSAANSITTHQKLIEHLLDRIKRLEE